MSCVDVCVSPHLLHAYELEGKIVVVVDILRASSSMTAAMAHGAAGIIPVASLAECVSLKNQGYLAAAERDGRRPEGFDFGNSPLSYLDNPYVLGRTIAMTTTNGTRAIKESSKAREILIGSFLNLSSLARYLHSRSEDIMILCAGWKGKINMEDTLFAGALAEKLEVSHSILNDAPLLAITAYQAHRNDLMGYLQHSSHFHRLGHLDLQDDVEFCLQHDCYTTIPQLEGERLIPLEPTGQEARIRLRA